MVKQTHYVHHSPVRQDTADALDRLLDLATRLAETMGRGMTERGLTRSRATLALRLFQHGPAVQRELSRALGVTPRYVTMLVDALQADGWVVRGPHPTDRRATVVSLTDRGMAAVSAMDAERRAWAQDLFGDVPSDDLATFVTIVERLARTMPRSMEEPLCPTPDPEPP
jgi:DNA-binding MarR family transcriptional regulator